MTKHLGRETILVTGSTGNVGSVVVEQLVTQTFLSSSPSSSRHNRIRAAVHSQNKVDKLERYDSKEVEIVPLDYNKTETIASALKNVDKLFLLVNPAPHLSISSSVIEEAKKNNIKHIVMLSSIGVNVKPEITIGRLHRQEEEIIEESGIPYTFLRANFFMQNFLTFFGQTIKTQNAICLPAGNHKVSFVDVRDIAAVAANILTMGGIKHLNKVYDITGGEALSFAQAAEILSNEIGRKIVYVNITEEDAREGLKEMGMENWLIDAIMEGFHSIRAGYGSQATAVVEQIKGRKPISFSQFAKDYAEAFT
jgi:uncharacterized protein YbjT (DUF2867 family)